MPEALALSLTDGSRDHLGYEVVIPTTLPQLVLYNNNASGLDRRGNSATHKC